MPVSLIDVNKIYANDPKLKPEDVKSLQEWAHRQPHLPEVTELHCAIFLQSCYYSNEAAKTAMDTYFTVKNMCPDIFGNMNPLKSPIKETLNVSLFLPLPKKTPEKCTLIFCRLVDCNPDNYTFTHQLKLFDMSTMLWINQNGPSEGYRIVFDMQGISFGHFTKLGIMPMKKFLYYLQDGMPVRLKGLHFLNTVSFMDKILALMKPFMKKELLDVLYLHDNVDSFTKVVPKDCLPQDYGGSVEPVNVLHEKMKQALVDNVEFFENEEKLKVDESQRPGKPKSESDVFGVEGTFKKLQVD